MAEKKTVKKKAPKSVASKKTATPKKVASVKKKVATKRSVIRKVAAESPQYQLTTVIADVDVGWGNQLYLRGEGGGLSWDKGKLMDWSDDAWSWSSSRVAEEVTFKFCLNDQIWAQGENMTILAGGTSISTPVF